MKSTGFMLLKKFMGFVGNKNFHYARWHWLYLYHQYDVTVWVMKMQLVSKDFMKQKSLTKIKCISASRNNFIVLINWTMLDQHRNCLIIYIEGAMQLIWRFCFETLAYMYTEPTCVKLGWGTSDVRCRHIPFHFFFVHKVYVTTPCDILKFDPGLSWSIHLHGFRAVVTSGSVHFSLLFI